MMVKLLKGWLKIYLFYGVIFFLLGFLGNLATDGARIADLSARKIKKFGYFLTKNFWHPKADQEIPVFSGQGNEVVLFVYSGNERNNSTNYRIKQVQNKLQSDFRRVLLRPVSDRHELKLRIGELSTQRVPWILVGLPTGLNSTAFSGSHFSSQFFFSLPDPSLDLVSTKIFQNMLLKFPTIGIHKYSLGPVNVIEFAWQGTAEVNSPDDEIFGIFLENIDPELLKKNTGRSFH